MRSVSARSSSAVQFSKTATESGPTPHSAAERGSAIVASQARASAANCSSEGRGVVMVTSDREHRAGADTRGSVDVGEPDPGVTDLPGPGLAAELGDDLVD